MRPDVKLGFFVMLVAVTVAGSYYLYRTNREKPIPVGALSSNNLAERTKTPTHKSNNNAGRSASTKRRAPIRSRPSAKPRRKPTDRRSAASTPTKQNRADTSPNSTTANPIKQRLTQRPLSTSPTSRNSGAKQKPGVSQPATHKKVVSNRQTQRPATSSPSASQSTRQPVSLAATTKTANRAAMETHRVLPGETLASISEMYYGSAQQAKLLLKANSSVANPRSLRVGMLIKIPAQDIEQTTERVSKRTSLIATAKKTVGKSYTVRSGDSLFVIAKRELGSGPRWKEIFELNKKALGNNPNRLKVGQSLLMPAS